MMKMKKILTFVCLVPALFAPSACRSFYDKEIPVREGVLASVPAPEPGDGIITRSLDADFGFSFLSGDRITVFNGKGSEYMTYALSPSKGEPGRASFNVEAFSLKDGLYYAVYPSLASLTDPESIQLPLTGQVQMENGSSEHLSAFDYCLSSAQIKDNSGYFGFEHKVCWLKVELPAGRNNTNFRKLTVSAGNGVGKAVALNAGTGAVNSSRKAGDELTLELGSGAGLDLGPSDTLVAFICLAPGKYSDLVLTAESTSGYKSVFQYSGDVTFESGKYYLAQISESDIVPLQEISEYGIYECDSEGRTMGWVPPIARFRRGEHQMSWSSGAGVTTFAFFELGTTDFASLRINSETLALNQNYQVDILSGNGQICSGASFKLIRKTDDSAWLFDSANRIGCVIRISEDRL